MRMKKLLTFLTLLTLFFGVGWAAEVTVTFTPGTDIGATSVTKNGVTATMTTMNNASYYQIYANQSGTITCSNGNIVKIEFTCTASGTNKYGPGNVSADVGSYTYSDNKGTWTGSSSSVTLSSTAQVRMTSLSVTYEGSGTSTYTVNIGNFNGGSVTADKTSGIEADEIVTLTIDADDDYELGSISVYKSDDVNTIVDLNGTGNTRTFTMPEYDVIVSATFNFTGTGEKYSLVTKTGDIIDGEDYIIVNNSKGAIAGPIGSNAFFSSITSGFILGDNTITLTGTSNEVFTLEADNTEPGYFYLKGKSCYYYIQGDKVKSTNSKEDASPVNIFYNKDNGFIYIGVSENQNISSNNRKLGYNYASPRFAPYASLATAQSGTSTIYLYKKGDPSSEPEVGEPDIEFGTFTVGETTLDVTITPGENATKTYYKVGNGEYVETDGTETIDLTQVESPITVYAKSSDNENNESAEAHMNFTVPALEVSISPASYSGYDAQEVTLTASNNVGNAAISYKIGDGEVQTYSAPFTVSEVGTHNITAYAIDQRASAVQAEATATITIAEQPSGETVVATFVAGTDQGGNGEAGNPDEMSKGDGQAQVTVSSTNAAFATSEYRLYQNSVTTISVPEGSTITKIEFICTADGTSKYGPGNLTTESGYSYSGKIGTWVGEANSVSFLASAQARCSGINVTYIVGSAPADLYIIGNVNGIDVDHWHANQGVKMTRKNGVYTADIWVTGKWNDQMQKYAGTFAFFTVLAENNDEGSWSYVNGNRYEPDVRNINNPDEQVGSNHWWLANDENSVNTNVTLLKRNWDDDFMIPAGLYTVTVSEDLTKFNLTVIKDLTPSITPDGGEVVDGTKATIALSENFNEFIENCPKVLECTRGDNGSVYAPLNLTLPEVKLYVNNEVAEGISGEYTFSAEQSPITVTGKGALVLSGTEYASKTASKDYTVVKKYTATIATGITGGAVSFNADTQQNTLNNLTAGYTVNVFVTENTDWELATLTYTAEGSTEAVNITATATAGQYSFAMPASNVTINATFNYIGTATLTTYRRITSTNEIEVGKKYLIVNEANNRVQLSGTENSVTIVINNHETTVSSDSGIGEFVLGSNNNGYYSFYSGGKYLANSGSSTYDIVNTLSDNCYWSISFTEPDADDNVYATIKAKNYERLVYYFGSTGGYFRTYSSNNYSSNVQLYKEVTPEMTLADICKYGVTTEGKNEYIIADKLQAVYAYTKGGNSLLWCKDLGNKSIVPTTIHSGQIDFMREPGINYDTEEGVHNGQQGPWDQSNWIVLQFTNPTGSNNIDQMLQAAQDKFIKPGTIKGKLVDNENYILKMDLDQLDLVTQADPDYDEEPYNENVYCPANFLPENLNIDDGIENGDGAETGNQNYFFMNPKVQEICYITYAQWDDYGYFAVPSSSNFSSGIDGAFQVGWVYQDKPELEPGRIYKFHAVVHRVGKEYGPNNPISTKDGMPVYENITVLPIDLTSSSTVVTAINTVEASNAEVKGVKYVNVAGMVSDRPFQGVNIVVTEYTDGTSTTSKMLRK